MKILKRLGCMSLTIALVCSSFSGIGFRLNVHAEEIVGKSFYVSPKGNDNNVGTIDAPFATLEKARDAVRQLKSGSGLPEGGVTVYLREGVYNRNDSFKLTEQDSGTESSPIVYKAYGNEKVSMTGGYKLDTKAFTTVKDEAILNRLPVVSRDKVLQIDLKAQGITEYGQISKAGYGWPKVPPAPELFIDGKSMMLSRYPNTGFLTTGTVIQQGFIPRDHMPDMPAGDPSSPDYVPKDQWINQPGPIFTYSDNRINNWMQENEIWLGGYWKWDWADDTLKVKSIDTVNKRIEALQPSMYGISSGKRYYAFNLLCEIDTPGEWYLDRSSGILYIYPEKDITSSEVQLSVLNKPLVDMNKASFITFKDITFEVSCGHGIKMIDSSNNKIIHCTFRRLGQKAVMIGDEEELANDPTREKFNTGYTGGSNNGIISCDIYDVGQGGIYILGGNRITLTPGGNYVENCNIYNYARILRTYTPGIFLNGVGNRASNNLIHNAPHFGIQFNGNDNIIENNEIYSVCEETSDSGVIYSGRDWTYRGNIIRNNYIHDIKNNGGLGSYAIYLDDLMCSVEATGNIFYKVEKGVFLIGGGRDSIVKNNIMIDCGTALIGDNRGMTWTGTSDHARIPDGTCYKNLMTVPYKSEVWATKYPTLATILDNTTDKTLSTYYKKPSGNIVTNNVLYNTGAMSLSSDFAQTSTVTDNKTYASTVDAGFVDKSKRNFSLKSDSIIYKDLPNFAPIPFDSIGLKIDEYRTNLNVNIGDFSLVSPGNNAADIDRFNVSFEWQKASGAENYQLLVAEDEAFTKIVVDQPVNGTTKIMDGFSANKTYYWKVIASCNSVKSLSGEKASTQVYRFTTGGGNIFAEDFENGFSKWNNEKGTPLNTSSDQFHSGTKSFIIDQDTVAITRNFSKSYNGIATIWYYDIMAPAPAKTQQLASVEDSSWVAIGADSTKTKGTTNYQIRIGGAYTATTVLRTKGWHKFTWDYTSGDHVDLYIDDVKVGTTTSAKAINRVTMGDFWSGSTGAIGYFDDFKLVVDETAPITEISVSGVEKNNWYSSDATVTLTAKDDLSGVNYTEYRIGTDQEWTVYKEPITLSSEGIFTLQYRSRDKAGNVEEIKEKTVRIDKSNPSFAFTVNGSALVDGATFEDSNPITFTASDNLSGVYYGKVVIDDRTYSLDAEHGLSVDMDFSGKVGTHIAAINIEDAAGNKMQKNFSFEVKTSVEAISTLINRYKESGELSGPLAVQLTNNLNQTKHQLDIEHKEQAAKHLADFLKHLNNKALENNVSGKSKEALNADAKVLVDLWKK